MKDYKYALEIMKQEVDNKYISSEIKYAFKASVKALEKQIPKKPTYDTWFGECPTCGNEFNSELVGEYSIKCCHNCGQRLNWAND